MAVGELTKAQQAQEWRRRSAATKKRKGEPIRLPVEPFARWIEGLVERYGWDEAGHRTETDPRELRRITKREMRSVHIDKVDRCLLAAGDTTLRDLYPGLYE